MGWNVCSRHRLTGGAGSRAGRIILSCLTSGRMRRQRSSAYNFHPKNPSIYPFSECFDSVSRTTVCRMFFLEIRQNTPGAINRPERHCFMVGFFYEFYDRLVFIT